MTRDSIASIQNFFTSLGVAQSFLSIDKNHTGRFSVALYNHHQIFEELQIWLLALTVSCTKFASHHIKTELMASVTIKWLDKAVGQQQWN